MMYKLKGPVPAEEYTIPLGVADIKRAGDDITIVATSSMVQVALGAAKLLEEIGISAEVIDPRTTWPLDEKTLIESAKKTSRAIVVDEGYDRYGVTAEIASVIADRRVLPSGRAGQADRRDARSDSVLAAARRRHRADRAHGVRSGAGDVQAVANTCCSARFEARLFRRWTICEAQTFHEFLFRLEASHGTANLRNDGGRLGTARSISIACAGAPGARQRRCSQSPKWARCCAST